MEGLAASVVLIAILLGVLLVVGGLVYLRATPAEAIAGAVQEASESADWDWMGHPVPARHRTMGGD
jgi:hypothetical protein